jgi:MoxR-like ATPase
MPLPDDLENETEKPAAQVVLPSPRTKLTNPEHYKPGLGLVDAIKVALLVRKALLLTGRPGTGKTELGHYLAWKMQLKAYQFDAKSTSIAKDLFYYYDAIGHFRSGDGEIRPYLTFHALGKAILECATPTDELKKLLPEFSSSEPKQAVVVIDEIDKAPRDFPNDLLNEVDKKYFHIPELKNLKVEADQNKAPILVITSNSEQNLPAAFLRRCIYYDIEFPKDGALRSIVSKRIKELPDSEGTLVVSAVESFSKLANSDSGMKSPPGTAELLDWIIALLGSGATASTDLRKDKHLVKATYQALVKTQDDRLTAKQLLALS